MSTIYKNGYCKNCQTTNKFCKVKANHTLHLILTIITLGIWLIPWSFIGGGSAWTCDQCGSKEALSKNIIVLSIVMACMAFIYIFLLDTEETAPRKEQNFSEIPKDAWPSYDLEKQ